MRFLSASLLLSLLLTGGAAARAAEPVDFNRDIRPVLSDNCFACHGPDADHREGGLRLDVREIAFSELESGAKAIVPGQPEASELIARINDEDIFLQMPPADSHKSLTDEERELLRRWIAEGAEYQQHWSYRPLDRPAPPDVKNTQWSRNAIDKFILARLEQEERSPAPETDRATLIRRLSFDLTGLPPTPAEVEAFVNDSSPDAYENLVDRLLASPQFGERMAIYWLDLARYADTKGYHGDNERPVWLYRDYVIDAFNENKPFDQFTIEQLAGDLLPGSTREQKIASGYNRLLQTTQEGGAQAKEYRAIYAADRVRNTATAFLGITMGCAQCHDHKFDPLTAKDFYSFAAFFADVKEIGVGVQPRTKMPTPEQQAELDGLDRKIAELEKQFNQPTPELAAAQETWEAAYHDSAQAWATLAPESADSTGGATLAVQDDRSVLASGTNPDQDTYTVTAPTELSTITAVRLEALTHESLPQQASGRSGGGNFVLAEFVCEVKRPDQDRPQPVKFVKAGADYSQKDFDAKNLIDGNEATGWAVDGHVAEHRDDRRVIFIPEQPIPAGPDTTLTFRLVHKSVHRHHNIGRFRLSLTAGDPKVFDVPSEVAEILSIPDGERGDEQKQKLAAHFRSIAPELEPLRKKIAQTRERHKKLLGRVPETLITTALDEPRTVRLLPRGNWMDDSGPVMKPAIPEFFGAIETDGQRATRLDLARWIVSPENPLTARTMANRFWMLMFGQAIARTPADMGSQGDWPSHPLLIDWLAVEFVESGWDVKHVLKTIALSSAYRQSSTADPEQLAEDPYNELFARQGRFRLPAEMVRDNALAFSGLLVKDIGGPSARPYQPPGYYAQLNFPKREYQVDTGSMQYRRGLYMHWQRTFLHPMLKAFDAPTREECTAQRPRSNTPLASLVVLNDPTFVEASRALAERIVREGGSSPSERINFIYALALGRAPAEEEIATLTALYEKHLGQYQADTEAAKKLISVGQKLVPEDIPPAELAAWTSVARVIMALHETITRS